MGSCDHRVSDALTVSILSFDAILRGFTQSIPGECRATGPETTHFHHKEVTIGHGNLDPPVKKVFPKKLERLFRLTTNCCK